MKKHRLNNIRRMILTVAAAVLLCVFAAAEPLTAELFTLESKQSISVAVEWQTQEPYIAFVSPTGQVMSESTGLVYQRKDNMLYCLLPDAAPGTWSIQYDKYDNPTIDVSWAPYYEALTLSPPTLLEINGDYARVEFSTGYPEETAFHYTVYAVLKDSSGSVSAQKELGSGSATTGQTVQTQLYLGDLSGYDNYFLMVDAWLDAGGAEVSATAVSGEAFSYTNDSQPAALESFTVEVDLSRQRLALDWSGHRINCTDYLVEVYSDLAPDTPLYYNEFDKSILSTDFPFDTSCASFTVRIAYRSGDRISVPAEKTVLMDHDVQIDLTLPEITSAAQAEIVYTTLRDTPATLTVNDVSQQINLKGSDRFSFALVEFENQVSIRYSTQEDVFFLLQATTWADFTPPQLRLYENTGVLTVTDSEYTFAGTTESSCALTINTETAAVAADGSFFHKVPLAVGENIFTVTATDKAGNTARQTVTILRQGEDGLPADGAADTSPLRKILPIAVSALFFLLLAAAVLIIFRRWDKREGSRGRRIAGVLRDVLFVLFLLSLIVLAVCFLLWYMQNRDLQPAVLFDMVLTDPQSANTLLQDQEQNRQRLILAGIISGGLLAVNLLILLLTAAAKKIRTSVQERPEKPKKEKKAKPEATAPTTTRNDQTGSDRQRVFCRFCGTENLAASKFCKKCGKALHK